MSAFELLGCWYAYSWLSAGWRDESEEQGYRIKVVELLHQTAAAILKCGVQYDCKESIYTALIVSGAGVLFAHQSNEKIANIAMYMNSFVDCSIIEYEAFRDMDLSFLDKLDD